MHTEDTEIQEVEQVEVPAQKIEPRSTQKPTIPFPLNRAQRRAKVKADRAKVQKPVKSKVVA